MFNFFKKNKKQENIKELLKEFRKLEEKVKGLTKELESFREKSKLSIQKVGIIRYNPFSNIGGDQSFSIALLDDRNDGVVITSLFSQEGNRVYGKPIKGGESNYELSNEEKRAIKKAVDSVVNLDTKTGSR